LTVRIGLIGCGAVARRFHMPALRAADAEVVAFVSRNPASAQSAANEWGSGKVLGDWRELLELQEVDAVDICTPNYLHGEIAIASSRAGKHVLVEKPIASSLEDADAMVAAARHHGTILMTAHNVRYAPPFVAIRNEVAAGSAGEVISFRAAFGHSGPRDWSPESDWFFDAAQSGGGVLIDLGIHVADLLRAILSDEAIEVSAILGRGDSDVEETAHVILRFAGGPIGSVHVSWNTRPAPDHQLSLFGTEGTIHLDTATPPVFRAASGEARPLEIPSAASDPYAEFVRAVETRPAPSPSSMTGEDGRAALAIIDAAYRSAREGRTVTVEAQLP
jgi:UDP-N-acetylglucosamine 3-dehydrogenase